MLQLLQSCTLINLQIVQQERMTIIWLSVVFLWLAVFTAQHLDAFILSTTGSKQYASRIKGTRCMFSTRGHSLYLCLTYFLPVCLAVSLCLPLSVWCSAWAVISCWILMALSIAESCCFLLKPQAFCRCISAGQSLVYITISAFDIETAQTVDCIYIWHICTGLLTEFVQLFICSIGFPSLALFY